MHFKKFHVALILLLFISFLLSHFLVSSRIYFLQLRCLGNLAGGCSIESPIILAIAIVVGYILFAIISAQKTSSIFPSSKISMLFFFLLVSIPFLELYLGSFQFEYELDKTGARAEKIYNQFIQNSSIVDESMELKTGTTQSRNGYTFAIIVAKGMVDIDTDFNSRSILWYQSFQPQFGYFPLVKEDMKDIQECRFFIGQNLPVVCLESKSDPTIQECNYYEKENSPTTNYENKLLPPGVYEITYTYKSQLFGENQEICSDLWQKNGQSYLMNDTMTLKRNPKFLREIETDLQQGYIE